jgi:site-specific DNA-cytosine methylase
VRVVDAVYVKGKRAQSDQDDETWGEGDVAPTVNNFDVGDTRAVTLVASEGTVTSLTKGLGTGGPDAAHAQAGWLVPTGKAGEDDPLLPLGLDSHRYKACGNAVVVTVAEWLGRRIGMAVEGEI